MGSPGGSRIITAILQSIVNDLDLEMHPYASVARGRIHHQFFPEKVYLPDSKSGEKLREPLERLGHAIGDSRWQAKVFLVRRDERGLIGVADPRGDGQPMGAPP